MNFRLLRNRLIAAALLTCTAAAVVHAIQPSKIFPDDSVIRRPSISEKVVALTFDDGPDPRFTPGILSSLEQYGVKATFFMIGERMEQYPELVREVIRGGHAIGNHTYTHPTRAWSSSPWQVAWEMDNAARVIERMSGQQCAFFRPPRGLIGGWVLSAAEERGYRTILWTVCADHHDASTPELMAARVVANIQPGAIILAHDGTFPSRWKDVAATPLIIQALQKLGYRFVTIPELLEIMEKERVSAGLAPKLETRAKPAKAKVLPIVRGNKTSAQTLRQL